MNATPEQTTPTPRPWRSAVTLAGGASLAVIPAATVAIAARLFPTNEQGNIAVAVTLATYTGQITSALLVEATLSTVGSQRRVTFPRWLGVLALAAAVAVIVAPPQWLLLALALPIWSAALEVGRNVSVAEHLDRREFVAAAAVGGGALVGVLAALAGQHWALIPLAAGIATATLVRLRPVGHRADQPSRHALGWVTADTAITGVVAPLLNLVILGVLGPTDAVVFTAIATVSGLLAIPLNFMRVRLLKHHSPVDIVVTAGAIAAAIIALLAVELIGGFGWFFGEAWRHTATLVPLLLACAWRAASLATTLPFAALRRRGAVRLVTGLRALVSLLTFALAGIGLAWHGLAAVFIGLLIAELSSALCYEIARRLAVRRDAPAPEAAS